MAIQILSEQVVSKIAAGEVVERPASVVKELLENSLDAGATTIHVDVVGGGRKRLRISDDGSGIPADEVVLAFARHATSKLQTADDLYRIETLGFRGEALASIAAVSHVTLTTRHEAEDAGTQIRLEGGEIRPPKAIGAPGGTVITIENLFFNTPARLKFLKSEDTEKRQIATFVTRYALAYPHVRFVLVQDGREIFRSSGSGQLADVVVKSLGLDVFRQMVEVADEDPLRDAPGSIKVWGYVSDPALNRKDRSRIILFVNGRSIQDSGLTYAVTQAYHTLLMKGQHPFAVLLISVPPEFVDVNVHPTKAEVRFRDSGAVFVAVQRTVRSAVVALAQTPTLRGSRRHQSLDSNNGWMLPYQPERSAPIQREMDLPLDEPGQFTQHRSMPAPALDDDMTALPEGMGKPKKPRTLPMLRVIGQVGAAYIVAEGPAGLYLIDQHAAHERIMYEQFMEAYEAQGIVTQHTLEAQTIDVSPTEARLLEEKLAALQAVGFVVEPFGMNTFVIRAVPALLADTNPIDAVAGIIQDLEQDKAPGQETVEAKIIRHVCKRASVKAGQILTHAEMQGIIRQLERCQSPLTCPHGRPTMLHISGDQLAREFGRLGAN